MTNPDNPNPFHAGELKAQTRAGAGDVAQWASGFIRDYLPEQHRDFHTAMPFLVIAGADGKGRTWTTLIEGPKGFIQSPDPKLISLASKLSFNDPLASAFQSGSDIGVLGIELATRRRNRFSGFVKPDGNGYSIAVRQTFGNCPQYIHQRSWHQAEYKPAPAANHAETLSESQIARIRRADTLFIGSGQLTQSDSASRGFDASHRGGEPGFVNVLTPTQLQIPDYAGNNFFNTIGNLITDPRVGLLFVDFETGGLLHLSGTATIEWDPARSSYDQGTLRIINIEVDAVIDRPSAISLRWTKQKQPSMRLRLAKRQKESVDITSFYFTSADRYPLKPFEAGQHLPMEISIPGQPDVSSRSYSLSGSPTESSFYRISVKREKRGLVSRFLHDKLSEGDILVANQPSGGFVIPCSQCPLVLVSAGVGLTPMLSMLHATAKEERQVWFIHGARNGRTHALGSEIDMLTASGMQVKKRIFYSRPDGNDIKGKNYDVKGRISPRDLIDLNAGPKAQYMICGPQSFIAEIRNGLEAAGIPLANIHFESFGPANQSISSE